MLSPKNKLNPAFREIYLLRINANPPSQNQKNQKNRSNRVFPLTFAFCDENYRRIALGLAAGNVVMIFADRFCGGARRRRMPPERTKVC